MPAKAKRAAKATKAPSAAVQAILSKLERAGSAKVRAEMSSRYGIHTAKAYGVPMRDMQTIAKGIGVDHDLALALWDSGWYEARMVAAMIDDPERVTGAQMDRWCKAFDNWAICDTVCFKLFDRTPHAWSKVAQWSGKRDEFVRRGAYALLWSLALYDKRSGNAPFVQALKLIEQGAGDDRDLVKKSVAMALRAIGTRNRTLNALAEDVARRLSESRDIPAQWVGRDVLKKLRSSSAAKR